jgi:hypothetical protein
MQTESKGREFAKSPATLAQAMSKRDIGGNPGRTGGRKANVRKHAEAVQQDADRS